MFTFLLVLQAIVTLALIGVILMQKSEGGGLGVGGSPTGFLSARGAADFLTRATGLLAVAFVALSIALAVFASINHRATTVDADAARTPAAPRAPAPGALIPTPGGPTSAPASLTPGAPATGAPAAGGGVLPGAVPLPGAPAPSAPASAPAQP